MINANAMVKRILRPKKIKVEMLAHVFIKTVGI